jgi:hypothetical protein
MNGPAPAPVQKVGKTEALHWNGTAWSAFSVPVPGGGIPAVFSAVAAGSPCRRLGRRHRAQGQSGHRELDRRPFLAPGAGAGFRPAAFRHSQGVVSNLTLRNG